VNADERIASEVRALRGPRGTGGAPRPAARRIVGAALLVATAAPLTAQEKPAVTAPTPAPAQGQAPAKERRHAEISSPNFFINPIPGSDDVEVFAQNLYLFLPDRGIELRADDALLWGDRDLVLALTHGGGDRKVDPLHAGPQIPTSPDRPPLKAPSAGDPEAALQNGLKEIYAEGHVFFRDGEEHVVFAERLYQHLLERRGVVVDCDLYAQTLLRDRKVPLHPDAPAPLRKVDLQLRARELRVLGDQQITAVDAQFTTCRFGNPHYHVHAGDLTVKVETDEELKTTPVVTLKDATLRLGDVPVAPLPDFAVDADEGQTLPLKRVKTGHSSRYGAFLETIWGGDLPETGKALTDELDLSKPLKLGWEADVDGYSERGPGLGEAFHWKAPQLLEGEMGGYWLHDKADHDQETDHVIDNPERGRAWLKDRCHFGDFWQLDTEVSYFSDEGFQPEFFEREFKEEKEPESYAHLIRQQDNTRLGLLYMNRLNSWQSQTDTLPGADFEQLGEPLMKLELPSWLERDGQANYLVLSHVESAGNYRDHPADSDPDPAERVVRADTQIELSTTVPIGPASIRPYASGEFTGWDRNSNDDANIGRAVGTAGARGELELHRNFDAYVPWLGIDGLRHIVLLEAEYTDVYDVSKEPDQLIQIDQIDQVKPLEQYLLAVRQRFQSHRRNEKGAIETVNVVDLDVSLPIYPHALRDNPVVTSSGTEGETYGPLHVEFRHRLDFQDKWLRNSSLFAETDWNLHEHRFSSVDLGTALMPAPEWTTLVSWLVTPGLTRAITGEIDYQLTEKWSVAALEQYDFFQGHGLAHRYELRRMGDDFSVAFGFEHDPSANNTSITIAIYPNFLGNRGHRSFVGGRGDTPGLDPNPF